MGEYYIQFKFPEGTPQRLIDALNQSLTEQLRETFPGQEVAPEIDTSNEPRDGRFTREDAEHALQRLQYDLRNVSSVQSIEIIPIGNRYDVVIYASELDGIIAQPLMEHFETDYNNGITIRVAAKIALPEDDDTKTE